MVIIALIIYCAYEKIIVDNKYRNWLRCQMAKIFMFHTLNNCFKIKKES